MKYQGLTFMSCIAAVFLMIAPANAQTPDGETPAEEDVCSTLAGGTPGLYGLCTAYCEAQDADIAFFSGDILIKTSHQKLLDNYNRKKQKGDPDMPCLRGSCPCFTANDVAAIGGSHASCIISQSHGLTRYLGYDENNCQGAATVQPGKVEGAASCMYRKDTPSGDIMRRCVKDLGIVVEGLTLEEEQACKDAVVAGAAQNGVACKISL
jgi:hypothetical protein